MRTKDVNVASLLKLYQALPIDQCVELYTQQYSNMTRAVRRIILATIGAKYVYKENYQPCKIIRYDRNNTHS